MVYKGGHEMERLFKRQKKETSARSVEMEKRESRPLLLIQAMAVAYAVTCCVFILCGILLTYTDLSEQAVPVISLLTAAVASAIAGFDWAKAANSRGIFWGLAAGLLYGVLLLALTVYGGGTIDAQSWALPAVSAAGGSFGGIVGINRKK